MILRDSSRSPRASSPPSVPRWLGPPSCAPPWGLLGHGLPPLRTWWFRSTSCATPGSATPSMCSRMEPASSRYRHLGAQHLRLSGLAACLNAANCAPHADAGSPLLRGGRWWHAQLHFFGRDRSALCPLLGPLAAPRTFALSGLDFGLVADLVRPPESALDFALGADVIALSGLLSRYSNATVPSALAQPQLCRFPGHDLARPLLLLWRRLLLPSIRALACWPPPT